MNRYQYVASMPTAFTDPLGLDMDGPVTVGDTTYYHIYQRGNYVGTISVGKNASDAAKEGAFQAANRAKQGASFRTLAGGMAAAGHGAEVVMRIANEPLDMVLSAGEFVQDPTVSTALGVMPFIPGGYRKVDDIVDATRMTDKATDAIRQGDGIVYKRINPKTGAVYIGQTKSSERFEARMKEHNRDLGVEHDYEIVGTAKPGKDLDVLEEDMIRSHGGLQKEGGDLVNKKHQMSEENYRAAGGAVNDPCK